MPVSGEIKLQWRRQDLLLGGANYVMGTHGGLLGRVQQLLDDEVL